MPSEHKKKKIKKEKITSSILIKNEPAELHPLAHYVDDPVELVRQIFGSMKSKTISSIIPDFLQKKSHEEIQEICLEELLGISKKRLLSIINATKCPSDTDSSDSDTSDVENIEEHISLEEISSDSNDDTSKTEKSKKQSSKNAKSNAGTTVKPSNSKASTADANGSTTKTGEKQYSILELLELQARARAIRSQLALEPVTKIELADSNDESGDNEAKQPQPAKEPATDDKNKTPTDPPPATKIVSEPATSVAQTTEPPRVPSTRPIRLKRNFRSRQLDEDEAAKSTTTENTESDATKNAEETATNNVENANESIATAEKTAEANDKSVEQTSTENELKDDDIIPIIAEPEILCITSSDSENEDSQSSNRMKRNYITMPTIEKTRRPPTDDEIFLQKVKQKTSIEAVIKQGKEKNSDEQPSKNECDSRDDTGTPVEIDETPEDGEIVDDEPGEMDVIQLAESSDDEAIEPATKESDSSTKSHTQDAESREKSDEGKKSAKDSDSDSNSENDDDDESSNSIDDDEKETEKRDTKDVEPPKRSDEDEDDDIIDLGKDEELDFDMKHEETPEPKNESWGSRWLRNNKVSKVLATAKLQSKMRSKIKEKKTKATVQAASEEVEDESNQEAIIEPSPDIATNVEVGSVEHYKELTKPK